ncbi:MAG: hypothetical protein ABSE73_28470 [Planctomycetota bacterium]
MTRLHKVLAVFVAVTLLAGADLAYARQGGGGGRGGGGGGDKGGGGGESGGGARNTNDNTPDNRNLQMRWYKSLAEALGAAGQDGIPVMAVLRRLGNLDDQKTVEHLGSWPQVAQLSKESLAAVRLNAEGKKAEELSAKVKLPSLPGIMWLDQYGNPILGQSMPGSADSIVAVVANWKTTMNSVDKFFKDHTARGEKLLERGKLRDAYLELALVAPFKGPEPEHAKVGLQKVKDKWAQLLDMAAKFPEENRSRIAILKGLRKDVQGTDYAAGLEEAIQKAGIAAQAAAAKPAETGSAAVAASGEPKAASAMPAVEDKPLSEVVSKRIVAEEQPSEDAGVNARFLVEGKNDERLKEAEALLQAGLLEFRKATADSADRGEARNALLREAHKKFEKALADLEQASGGKPDTQTEKLMERISFLMYGCLKYQSL